MGSMKNFVNDFFDSITLFKIITINDIDFQAATLNDDQLDEVADCGASTEMLDLAVKYGFSRNNEKIIDTDYAEHMDSFWKQDEVGGDTTTKHQLGKYIIEINGLEEHLTAKIEEEKALVDGDAGTQEEVADLHQHRAIANQ